MIAPDVVERMQTLVEEGKVDQAIESYRNSPVLAGRILSRGLEEYRYTSADIETSLQEAGERGLQVLPNNLAVLTLVAKVAPLLGLFGTVVGMIIGFEELAQSGVGKEKLADAIRLALMTTAGGLFVAIPTVVANTFFRSRIRRLQAEFEEILIDFVKTVRKAKTPKISEEENTPNTVENVSV